MNGIKMNRDMIVDTDMLCTSMYYKVMLMVACLCPNLVSIIIIIIIIRDVFYYYVNKSP